MKSTIQAISFLTLAALSANARSSDTILVQSQPTINGGITIPTRVTDKCKSINEQLGKATLSFIQKELKQSTALEVAESVSDAYVLKMEIIGLIVPAGGAWSGSKSITARASIEQNGNSLLSTVQISNGRGTPISGNCDILNDVVEDLSEKIAVWFIKAQRNHFENPIKSVGPAVAMVSPAIFANREDVPAAVLEECDVDFALANRQLASLNRFYADSIPVSDISALQGRRILQLTINRVIAPPGGAASGSKSMTVRATLYEDGQEIAHFDTSAEGGRGGIFGQVFKSACSILEGVSNEIAVKTTKWLMAYDKKNAAQPIKISE